jgi:hypothetical protein
MSEVCTVHAVGQDRCTLRAVEQHARAKMVFIAIHHGTALALVALYTRSSTTVALYRGTSPIRKRPPP